MHSSDSFLTATGPVPVRMTSDYLFKALLQKNPSVLKALISSLLHLAPGDIRAVRILNPIVIGEHVDSKEIVLDVNVAFNDATLLDLELQVADEHNWVSRSLYYACRNYTGLNGGASYADAMASLQIGFLDFTLFRERPVFYDTYRLLSIHDHFPYTDKFSVGIVDLTQIGLATQEDRRYNIDRWARLFKSRTWEDIRMLAKQDIDIHEAAQTVWELTRDDRVRQLVWAREDYERRQRDRQIITERLNRQIAEQQTKLSEQQTQLADQRKQITKAEQQLADQQTQLADQRTKLAEQQTQIGDQQKQIADLQAQLAAARQSGDPV